MASSTAIVDKTDNSSEPPNPEVDSEMSNLPSLTSTSSETDPQPSPSAREVAIVEDMADEALSKFEDKNESVELDLPAPATGLGQEVGIVENSADESVSNFEDTDEPVDLSASAAALGQEMPIVEDITDESSTDDDDNHDFELPASTTAMVDEILARLLADNEYSDISLSDEVFEDEEESTSDDDDPDIDETEQLSPAAVENLDIGETEQLSPAAVENPGHVIVCTKRMFIDADADAGRPESTEPAPKVFKADEANLGNNASSESGQGSSMALTLSSTELCIKVVKKPAIKEPPKKRKWTLAKKQEPNTILFLDYQFFLTLGDCHPPSDTASSSRSQPQAPLFDKDVCQELIESLGGVVVDEIGKEEGHDNTFLISDHYARTAKYIYSLAAATIPCVSYKWIQECIAANKIVAWKSFELSAGWSLEANQVVPAHKRKPLNGFGIFITAEAGYLYDRWKPLLKAADAKLLKPKIVKGKMVDWVSDIPKGARVVVTDSSCSKHIIAIAHEKLIPIVTPEWLVQCFITGNRAEFLSHARYRVEFEDWSEEEYDDEEEDDEESSEDESDIECDTCQCDA